VVGAGKVIPEATSSVQRWFFQFDIDGFLSQTICLLYAERGHYCPQSVPFPSDVGALLSLDLKNWLSYVAPCSCGAVVPSLLYRGPHTPRCTALQTQHHSVCVWVKQCLSEGVLGFEVHWNVMFGSFL